MTPQQHTELLNAVLTNPAGRILAATDMLQCINELCSFLTAWPRPALEQLIAAVRQDCPQPPSIKALDEVTKRLDTLYMLV